jgi:excinuclease ABC subunit B
MGDFNIQAPFEPKGDQPAAITALVQHLQQQHQYQTLLGATGTGKTHTMARVIDQIRQAHPGAGPQQNPGGPALQ